MAATSLFARALKLMGKTSAVESNIAEVVGSGVRKYGQLSKNSKAFGDITDVQQKVEQVKGIVNGQIDDAFRQGFNQQYAGQFAGGQVTETQAVDAVANYKKQLNRVMGGNKGTSELIKGMPEDFMPKLEALTGELKTKIVRDIEDINTNFMIMENAGTTKGHLSLPRMGDNAVKSHMNEINKALKIITKPFIDSSPYKSWEDFQRLNWNDEILDHHYNMSRKLAPLIKRLDEPQITVSNATAIEKQIRPLVKDLTKFNDHNSIVLKGNELADTRFLKWIWSSKQEANIHYLAKNGDKYSIKLEPKSKMSPQLLSYRQREEVASRASSVNPSNTRFEEGNEALSVVINKLHSNESKRFKNTFGLSSEADLIPMKFKKELKGFAHKEGVDDTNNVIKALKTLGLGAEYTSKNMSQSSLQLLGIFSKKAQKQTKRVENLLEQGLSNPDYIGKVRVSSEKQGLNTIQRKQKTPIREVQASWLGDSEKMLKYNGDMFSYRTKMDATLELNPYRRIDGAMKQDPIGKNIIIDQFFEGRNLQTGSKERLRKGINAIMEEDPMSKRYTAKSLLDKLQKEGNYSRKLDVVNSFVTSLDEATPGLSYKKFLDNVLPDGMSHKKFISELADEVVDIERTFKQQFGEEAKLFMDVTSTQFDSTGRFIPDNPVIKIYHSGVSVRETTLAKDFLRQNFGFAAPLAPGFKFSIEDKEK